MTNRTPRRARCRQTTRIDAAAWADDRPPAIVLGPSEGHDAIEDRADLWRSGAARARERQADAARPAGLRRRVVEPAEPGRGINLFKSLRQNFRAIVSCRGNGGTVTPLMLRSDAKRRVSKHAPAGCHGRELRVRRNPGRGINLFKALRRILRALVMPRDGLGDGALPPSSRAKRRSAGVGVSMRSPGATSPPRASSETLLRGRLSTRSCRGRPFNHFSTLRRDFRAAEERRAKHRGSFDRRPGT